MINHVLLELFCLKSRDDQIKECDLDCPTYECLVNKCQFCAFTSHANALCYVNDHGCANHIISLGNEMLPQCLNPNDAKKIWEKIAVESIEKAYDKYMKKISR